MFEFITKERQGYIYGSIGKHKAWELEIGKSEDWNWFEFRKTDSNIKIYENANQ